MYLQLVVLVAKQVVVVGIHHLSLRLHLFRKDE